MPSVLVCWYHQEAGALLQKCFSSSENTEIVPTPNSLKSVHVAVDNRKIAVRIVPGDSCGHQNSHVAPAT